MRLVRWADGRVGAPFVWGETDCAMLAFEAVDALSGGVELVTRYRGCWSSEREARRFQVREKTDTVRMLLEAGCVPVPKGFHQRGDVLLTPKNGFQCAHVCFGALCLSSCPADGTSWCLTSELTDVTVLHLPG